VASSDPWPTIHAERSALVADLESLTDAQWATPSLCAGWSVRDGQGRLPGRASGNHHRETAQP
jgi:hypothetical protein